MYNIQVHDNLLYMLQMNCSSFEVFIRQGKWFMSVTLVTVSIRDFIYEFCHLNQSTKLSLKKMT